MFTSYKGQSLDKTAEKFLFCFGLFLKYSYFLVLKLERIFDGQRMLTGDFVCDYTH